MLKGILKKKLNNDKGFTLAELLIVVAIIAILVAVSIPVFTSRLDEAKKNTDMANIRAAKAAAVNWSLDPANTISADTKLFYDAEKGILVTSGVINGYGKSATEDVTTGASGAPIGKFLEITFTTQGGEKVPVLEWVNSIS